MNARSPASSGAWHFSQAVRISNAMNQASSQVSNLDRHEVAQRLRDQRPMAMRRVRLEAEQTDPPSPLDDVGPRIQLGARLGGPEVLEKDCPHVVEPAGAGRRRAGGGGAQPAQMEVLDPRAAQIG